MRVIDPRIFAQPVRLMQNAVVLRISLRLFKKITPLSP
jgi:hypothetical protein